MRVYWTFIFIFGFDDLQDSEEFLLLKRQYDMAQAQLESERRQTAHLMQVVENLRSELARRDSEKGVREVRV